MRISLFIFCLFLISCSQEKKDSGSILLRFPETPGELKKAGYEKRTQEKVFHYYGQEAGDTIASVFISKNDDQTYYQFEFRYKSNENDGNVLDLIKANADSVIYVGNQSLFIKERAYCYWVSLDTTMYKRYGKKKLLYLNTSIDRNRINDIDFLKHELEYVDEKKAAEIRRVLHYIDQHWEKVTDLPPSDPAVVQDIIPDSLLKNK
ncbi:MAG TPA: hypothetical protein VHM26_09150 [Chitinophagaceae bacterium]|nr:hypothetical protein [Chitinophagaceae bacterium]